MICHGMSRNWDGKTSLALTGHDMTWWTCWFAKGTSRKSQGMSAWWIISTVYFSQREEYGIALIISTFDWAAENPWFVTWNWKWGVWMCQLCFLERVGHWSWETSVQKGCSRAKMDALIFETCKLGSDMKTSPRPNFPKSSTTTIAEAETAVTGTGLSYLLQGGFTIQHLMAVPNRYPHSFLVDPWRLAIPVYTLLVVTAMGTSTIYFVEFSTQTVLK